jgi:hypothetical protein
MAMLSPVYLTLESRTEISNPKVQLIELEDNDKDKVAVIGLTEQIRNTQKLLSIIVQKEEENRRHKRGLFNFVGKISKTLFGTMDDDNMQFYHEQIERFEQGSTTLTQLVKQQLIIVKSALGVFNETLSDVEYNERKLEMG